MPVLAGGAQCELCSSGLPEPELFIPPCKFVTNSALRLPAHPKVQARLVCLGPQFLLSRVLGVFGSSHWCGAPIKGPAGFEL